MIATALSIAGSDPSGGAGIQADLKSFSARGAYGMAALTALTAQNTQGVAGVHVVPAPFVADQIAAVRADVRIGAVKIGMIASAEIAETVADALEGIEAPIVLDPVMVAKGGHPLLPPEAMATVRDRLVPLATVITPNLPEAAALLDGAEASSMQDMVAQTKALVDQGAKAVLLKGGHMEGETSSDLLLSSEGRFLLDGRRHNTKNTHGTGCSLSAALAAELAKGRPLPEAARTAKDWLSGAIAAADTLHIGEGHGPIHHFHNVTL